MKEAPTNDQLLALFVYSICHGRNWKSSLRHAWETGIYDSSDDSMNLQQVRNNLGPSWLVKFRLKDHNYEQ